MGGTFRFLELLSPATIDKLVAVGLLSSKVAIVEREVRALMQDYPGRPAPGTYLRRGRKFKQVTRLPRGPDAPAEGAE